MKKLYLLLTSSLILLTGVGTLTTTVNGCTKGKETVYDALEKFGKEENPIEIPYQGLQVKASDPAVAKVIKKVMKSKNPTIFTSEVIKNISFDSTLLKVNTAVKVQTTYEKRTTPIYVKEAENPIYKELAKFNKNNPLEIVYDINNPTPKASDPKAASKIRSSLKLNNKTIFTDEVTKKINFESDQLKKDEPILVQATYEKRKTPIYVKEVENPIYKELAKFNKNNPLEIVYDINNPTPKASDPKAASKIRSSLKLNNKTIFTDEVTKKINFESDQLKKDEPILVQATYEKRTTPIYVKEEVDIALWISNELEK